MVVHDGATVLQLLELFKEHPVQVAVVADEHGSVQGIVTQTDLLEAVAGDIPEEDEDPAFVEREDGSILIDAVTPIVAVLARLGLPARMPKEGDRFELGTWRLEVVDMDGLRGDKVLATRA